MSDSSKLIKDTIDCTEFCVSESEEVELAIRVFLPTQLLGGWEAGRPSARTMNNYCVEQLFETLPC